jgi:hypothetical protein
MGDIAGLANDRFVTQLASLFAKLSRIEKQAGLAGYMCCCKRFGTTG